jgi:mRNA interferase MazF
MEEGSVVKVRLHQPDGSYKFRPALILKKKISKYDDVLLCAISSQLRQYQDGFDELIDEKHPDYKASGLILPSVIRLGMINTFSIALIQGTLGKISQSTHRKLVHNLAFFLEKQA